MKNVAFVYVSFFLIKEGTSPYFISLTIEIFSLNEMMLIIGMILQLLVIQHLHIRVDFMVSLILTFAFIDTMIY